MKRLCVVTTTDLIVNFFLKGLLRALSERYAVTLVVNTGDAGLLSKAGIQAELKPLRIERQIAPAADLAALYRLSQLLRAGKFDAVVSLAPKAGLLAALAARMAGIPFRCHVFQGEVWATRSGPMRWLLKTLDRLVAALSTQVLVISRSEREFLLREGVLDALEPAKSRVIANGSLSGVDLARFREDAVARREVRGELGIAEAEPLVLYLGRLTRDKGVLDLARAFEKLGGSPAARLLYAGPDEEGLRPAIEFAAGGARARVLFAGLTDRPERYIAAADVVALPSHREGFGNVLIEAAAAGVPSVAARIYGIEDAVVDGETGLLHAPGDAGAIAACLGKMLSDPALRARLGASARSRARERFSSETVIAWWLACIDAGLRGPDQPRP